MFIIPSLNDTIHNSASLQLTVEKPEDPFTFTRQWIQVMGTGTCKPLSKLDWILPYHQTHFTPSNYISLAKRKQHLIDQKSKRKTKKKRRNKNERIVVEEKSNENDFDALLRGEMKRQEDTHFHDDEGIESVSYYATDNDDDIYEI